MICMCCTPSVPARASIASPAAGRMRSICGFSGDTSASAGLAGSIECRNPLARCVIAAPVIEKSTSASSVACAHAAHPTTPAKPTHRHLATITPPNDRAAPLHADPAQPVNHHSPTWSPPHVGLIHLLYNDLRCP